LLVRGALAHITSNWVATHTRAVTLVSDCIASPDKRLPGKAQALRKLLHIRGKYYSHIGPLKISSVCSRIVVSVQGYPPPLPPGGISE
jgi:hypothetical protein